MLKQAKTTALILHERRCVMSKPVKVVVTVVLTLVILGNLRICTDLYARVLVGSSELSKNRVTKQSIPGRISAMRAFFSWVEN